MNKRIISRLSKGMSLFSSWTFGWTTAIYSNKFLKKIKAEFCPLNAGFDVLFLTNVLANQPKVVLVDGIFYYYLQRATSITKKADNYNTQSWMLNILKILLVAITAPMKKEEFLTFFSAKINIFMHYLNELKQTNDNVKVYQDLLASVLKATPYIKDMHKIYPTHIKEWNTIEQWIKKAPQKKEKIQDIQNIVDAQINKINLPENKNA